MAEAVAGTGPFKKLGPQTHVSVIADLFPEDVHLVVARRAHIATIAQLRGKRVSLGDPGSGTIVTARAILAAYRIATWRIKAKELSSDVAADALEKGKIDAFFFVGGAPVGLIHDLIARGAATLVPIDGIGRKRLLKRVPSLSAARIEAGRYPGLGAIDTVSVRAALVVNADEPNDVVYAVTRALFNPANRALLDHGPSRRQPDPAQFRDHGSAGAAPSRRAALLSRCRQAAAHSRAHGAAGAPHLIRGLPSGPAAGFRVRAAPPRSSRAWRAGRRCVRYSPR